MVAANEVSGGYSGAEIISVCREAALLAIEEADDQRDVQLSMNHLFMATREVKRQITPTMLQFYADYGANRG